MLIGKMPVLIVVSFPDTEIMLLNRTCKKV
jgi:hypothetical protein